MPNGDLIDVPYQMQIREYLIGEPGPWRFDRARPIGGLGQPEPKKSDLPYVGRAGSFGGEDHHGDRIITIPLRTVGTGVSDTARTAQATDDTNELLDAWALSDTDLRLDWWLAPGRSFYVFGRPRYVDVDYSQVRFALVSVLLTFETTDDPTLHPVSYPLP